MQHLARGAFGLSMPLAVQAMSPHLRAIRDADSRACRRSVSAGLAVATARTGLSKALSSPLRVRPVQLLVRTLIAVLVRHVIELFPIRGAVGIDPGLV